MKTFIEDGAATRVMGPAIVLSVEVLDQLLAEAHRAGFDLALGPSATIADPTRAAIARRRYVDGALWFADSALATAKL